MVRLADVFAIQEVRDLVEAFCYAFSVSVEDLHLLSNTSVPGYDQYTVEESNRAWSGRLGQYLISDLESAESIHSYHALQQIYGNMASHYSGYIECGGISYGLPTGSWKAYKRLSNVKLPGYKIVLCKSSKRACGAATGSLQNARPNTQTYQAVLLVRRHGVVKSAVESDRVRRPPYYTPAQQVAKIIRMTDMQYHCYCENTKRAETSLAQLQQWSAQIKAANIEKERLRKMPGVHARIFLNTLHDLQWDDMCDDGCLSSGMFVSDLLRQLQDRGCVLASSTEAFYCYYGGEGSAATQIFYALQEAYRETKSTISGWELHFTTGQPDFDWTSEEDEALALEWFEAHDSLWRDVDEDYREHEPWDWGELTVQVTIELTELTAARKDACAWLQSFAQVAEVLQDEV